MDNESVAIAIIGLIVFMIVALTFIVYFFENKKPQAHCLHEMDTKETWRGTRSNSYLSTCKKCGYQVKSSFGNGY
jgi:hypothetical protein